jgi:tetratricopeptide (TPR) repeat protein
MARFEKLEFEQQSTSSKSTTHWAAKSTNPDWREQAVEERRCGKYEQALRMYSRALEDDKSLVDCWLGQVQMLVLLDEHVEAELWGRKALDLFPGNGDLMAGRAQAMRRMGDTSQGLVLSDGSLKSAGQSAYRWMVRGELMAAMKQDTDRHCFDKAVLTDKDWLVPLEIACIYLELGLPSRALERIRSAVQLAPDRYHPWYIQGRTEHQLNLREAAKASWEHCVGICPDHENATAALQQLDQGGSTMQRLWRTIFGSA